MRKSLISLQQRQRNGAAACCLDACAAFAHAKILRLSSILLRKQRGYRIIDHLFTLHLLGYLFRLIKPRNPKSMPKFLRKSAMGIDSLFK